MDTTIRQCLRLLVENKELTPDQISACISEIMTQKATPALTGAFLVALKTFTPDVLFHSAKSMSSFALKCEVGSDVLDIVGTGGDQHDTFNVSTASAFVVAACGVKVAKHGNRSSSGRCGSADLIEALGAKLDLEPERAVDLIRRLNFGFLFAQKFHPAMKAVGPIRREIGVRTIFNVLGPLTNPADPSYILSGVGTVQLGELYAQVFKKKSIKRAIIVHSNEGLDEISPAGETQAWIVEPEKEIERRTISPADFGLPTHPLESVFGSTPDKNAEMWRKVMDGQEGPIMDFVLINSSAALVAAGKASDFRKGVDIAREAIKSLKVKHLVEQYIVESNK